MRTIGIVRARASRSGLQNLAYNIRRLVTLERLPRHDGEVPRQFSPSSGRAEP